MNLTDRDLIALKETLKTVVEEFTENINQKNDFQNISGNFSRKLYIFSETKHSPKKSRSIDYIRKCHRFQKKKLRTE